jgi:uncharacterized protein
VSVRLSPTVTRDTEFFWNGVKEHRLLIQRCAGCGQFRHPPRPMCPSCNSVDWNAVEASGNGTVYSFVLPRHPQFPFMEYPYIVALVELEEGTRIVSNIVGTAPEDVSIGLPVVVTFEHFDDGLVLPQFTPREAR